MENEEKKTPEAAKAAAATQPGYTEFMNKLTSLCKRRGIIFQSSEIYGGCNGFWDYGPNGAPLKRAVERAWWKYMIEDRDNVVGLDSTIICHPEIWRASGHVSHFSDQMTDCRDCKKRWRVDQLPVPGECPSCHSHNLTEPRDFNLMMQTYVGPVFDEEHKAYLRAESCQPIFVDFNTIRVATRKQLPFGIAQTGKAFRNEINPRNFTFRSREFMQMEMEFFCEDEGSLDWFEYWRHERWNFYTKVLRIPEEKLRWHWHEKLAHYAKQAVDIEYLFPFGWDEIEGIHHRGTWDMSACEILRRQAGVLNLRPRDEGEPLPDCRRNLMRTGPHLPDAPLQLIRGGHRRHKEARQGRGRPRRPQAARPGGASPGRRPATLQEAGGECPGGACHAPRQ